MTPQNVFVTYDGQVKVVDFGIAKADGRASETKQGIVKGKVRYMSPEQAVGQHVDRRADIFAAGVLLWEAATGQRLWKGVDEIAIIQALVAGEYDASPRAVDPSVPEAIDAICRKAMAFEANDRYASAADFRWELESFLADDVVTSRRSLGPLVSEMFAKERRKLREVIEETSKGNVEPMSLFTFTAASASQAWSTPSIAPRVLLSTVPPPPAAPSLAPVMLATDTQSCLASDEEPASEEPSSRIGGYLAALALAASIALAFSGPRIADVAQGGASSVGSPREVAEIVAARTELARHQVSRGKKHSSDRAATTLPSVAAASSPARATHELREAAPPPTPATTSMTPATTTPTNGTIGREGTRRKPLLDTADPWSAAHR